MLSISAEKSQTAALDFTDNKNNKYTGNNESLFATHQPGALQCEDLN